jgi:hypothetical protein
MLLALFKVGLNVLKTYTEVRTETFSFFEYKYRLRSVTGDADRGLTPSPEAKAKGEQETAGQSTASPAMAKSAKRIAFGADQPSARRLP